MTARTSSQSNQLCPNKGNARKEFGAASVKKELQLKESIIKILHEQMQKEKAASMSQINNKQWQAKEGKTQEITAHSCVETMFPKNAFLLLSQKRVPAIVYENLFWQGCKRFWKRSWEVSKNISQNETMRQMPRNTFTDDECNAEDQERHG